MNVDSLYRIPPLPVVVTQASLQRYKAEERQIITQNTSQSALSHREALCVHIRNRQSW